MGYYNCSPCDYYDEDQIAEATGYVKAEDYYYLIGVKEILKELVKDIYVTGDIKNAEMHLEELCDKFNVRLPDSLPMIKKLED